MRRINICKIAITDHCGATCTLCPQHTVTPQRTMSPDMFNDVLHVVWKQCKELFINSTGDYLSLPNHQEYSDILARHMRWAGGPTVSVTTNGNFHSRPHIHTHVLVCSLNAVEPEAFEKHIGIQGGLDRVVENIRQLCRDHGYVEIHSVKWAGNPHPERRLLELFGDTQAYIRICEEPSNQMEIVTDGAQADVTRKRAPCSYLTGTTITPAGDVKRCAHDFFDADILGHYAELDAALDRRDKIMAQHQAGQYLGVCSRCDFNLAQPVTFNWIKR